MLEKGLLQNCRIVYIFQLSLHSLLMCSSFLSSVTSSIFCLYFEDTGILYRRENPRSESSVIKASIVWQTELTSLYTWKSWGKC